MKRIVEFFKLEEEDTLLNGRLKIGIGQIAFVLIAGLLFLAIIEPKSVNRLLIITEQYIQNSN